MAEPRTERQKLRDWLNGLKTENFEYAPAHGTPYFSKYIVMPGVEAFLDRIIEEEAGRLSRVDETPHPDAGNLARNHYDWFMPDNPTADVDANLDAFEAKMREALTDPFVHDMAHSVLPLIAAYRARSRVDETPPDALDAAWKAAEAALPEGWAFAGLYLSRKMQVWTARVYRIGEKHPFGKPGEGVIATDGGTPQAALNGLAALLNATPPASSSSLAQGQLDGDK